MTRNEKKDRWNVPPGTKSPFENHWARERNRDNAEVSHTL